MTIENHYLKRLTRLNLNIIVIEHILLTAKFESSYLKMNLQNDILHFKNEKRIIKTKINN